VAPPPVSASDAQELAVALHDLAWALPRSVDAEVETELESLPPSEVEVMRLLVRRPGLSVREVAEELNLQQSNASTTVSSLVTRGLLERQADTNDGRVTRLMPTDEASRSRRIREQEWGRRLREHMSELSSAQVRALVEAAPALRALAAELRSSE
jgi:DNA-binding MarR family transcriptional regulator